MPRESIDHPAALALASEPVATAGSVECCDTARPTEKSTGPRLSKEVLERLSTPDPQALRTAMSRLAFMHFDLTALGDSELHPNSVRFAQRDLAPRHPGVTQGPSFLMISYYVEADTADARYTASLVAREIAEVLALGPQAVTKVQLVGRDGTELPATPPLTLV